MNTLASSRVPAQISGSVICRDHSCQHAISHVSLCECPCGGTSHGLVHRPRIARAVAAIEARIAATGDVFLGAANDDDDEEW